MRTPASLVAIPLLVGCAVGVITSDAAAPHLPFAGAAAALLALLAGLTAALDDDAPVCVVCVVVGAGVVGVSLGVTSATAAYRPSLLRWYETTGSRASPVTLVGVLREDAALMEAGVSLTIDVERIRSCEPPVEACVRRVRGGVRLSVMGTQSAGAMPAWRAGRTLVLPATLRDPVSFRDPGVPDERRALARRGIVLVGSVKSAALVEVTARGSPADEGAAAFRAWTRAALTATVGGWSGRSAGVATAIAIGDRTGLTQEDERRLQEAGTYHVIAISGGNIAIVTILLLGLLRRLGLSPRVAAALTILVLLFYGRVTGSSPSVERAIAAAVVHLSARLLDLRSPPRNILAIAATLGLAASPVAVFDAGFLLSFGATLAILVGASSIAARLPTGRPSLALPLRRSACTLLAATIAAELALAPITAALFARVTFAGLLLNFAAIPLMTAVQAASMAALALSLIAGDLARACGYVAHAAARGLVDSAQLVDLAPWLSREVVPPAWWLLAGYYTALILSAALPRHARRAAFVAATLGVVIVVGPQATSRDGVPAAAAGTLRVVFLDVGQGDATLLVLPDRRAFLIDAGGRPSAPLLTLDAPSDGPAFDIGERVVARTLRAFGVRSLDTLVLTHGDPDHIGGAPSVIRRFRPRAVWEGVPVPRHLPLQVVAAAAREAGAEWRTVQAGDRVRVGEVAIEAWHPPPPDWERQRVRNDDSIVLGVRYGAVLVVLPGDVGREGERAALGHLQRAPVVVLKAPHHGSATSSTPEWLDALAPDAAIFSAGRNNRFGHPAPVVVDRYAARGTAMFNTAHDGALILETNGTRVEITGWSSGRRWRREGE